MHEVKSWILLVGAVAGFSAMAACPKQGREGATREVFPRAPECQEGSCEQDGGSAGGANQVHIWAGTNSLKLQTAVCQKSSDCASPNPVPLGTGGAESYCICADGDKYPNGAKFECRAGGVSGGAAAGHCVYQVRESVYNSVCIADTPSVCGNGTNHVMCNDAGTGWLADCP